MIKHYWTILVKKSHIDSETNNLILGESIEEIQFTIEKEKETKFQIESKEKKYVMLPFELEIISYLERTTKDDSNEIPLEVDIITPNETVFKFNPTVIPFKEKDRTRHRYKTNALPVNTNGRYLIRSSINNNSKQQIISEIPLFITLKFN